MLAAGPKSQLHGVMPPGHGSAWSTAAHNAPYTWQAPILDELTGDSRPRVAYVQVARKNGKSFLGAAAALDEMCTRGGQVFLIADSERNLKSALFFELNTLVRKSPVLRNLVLQYKDHLECPSSGGGIYLRPNNLSASQSINPDLVVFDEVHMQKDDRIWNGMVLATAAMSRGLVLGITTPGYDINSMAHGLYLRAKAGEDLYSRIFEPHDGNCAFDDDDALRQANPVLEDRPELLEVFKGELPPTLPEHDYRRFRLGQWTTTASAWFPYGRWEALEGLQRPATGDRIWVGFDGSYSGDSTALVACDASGHVFVLGAWENPGSKGWRVPRAEVMQAVDEAFSRFTVVAMYCDPPYWGREIAEWDAKYPGRIVEFPTFSRARMAPACTTFYTAGMDGRLSHDGDPRLRRHVANCVVKPSPQGDYISKQDKDSPAKIDLAVAAVLAFQGAATTVLPVKRKVFVM